MGACIALGRLYAFLLGAVDVIYVWIYLYIHPTWIYPLNSSKKVVQERDDTNQNVDVLQSTPGICVLDTFFFFSLSLSTYDWVTGFGRRDDHYSNLSLSFCQKSGDMRMNPRSRIISNLLIWPSASSSDSSAFFSPTLPPLGLCKSTNKSNQSANPKHQKSHPSMCWNFRRQHVLRIAAKQFALGAVKVGTTESICFASRSIFVSLVMVLGSLFIESRIEENWRWKSWLM